MSKLDKKVALALLKRAGVKLSSKTKTDEVGEKLKETILAMAEDGKDVGELIESEEEIAVLEALGFEINRGEPLDDAEDAGSAPEKSSSSSSSEEEAPPPPKKSKGKASKKKSSSSSSSEEEAPPPKKSSKKDKAKSSSKKDKAKSSSKRTVTLGGKAWLAAHLEKVKTAPKKDVVAAYQKQFGEKGKWTCGNYLSEGKSNDKLFGYLLHEFIGDDGARMISINPPPKGATVPTRGNGGGGKSDSKKSGSKKAKPAPKSSSSSSSSSSEEEAPPPKKSKSSKGSKKAKPKSTSSSSSDDE